MGAWQYEDTSEPSKAQGRQQWEAEYRHLLLDLGMRIRARRLRKAISVYCTLYENREVVLYCMFATTSHFARFHSIGLQMTPRFAHKVEPNDGVGRHTPFTPEDHGTGATGSRHC